MLYYEDKGRAGKRFGMVLSVLYVGMWVALMFLVSFSTERAEAGEGILIDFGDSEFGEGFDDPDTNFMAENSSSDLSAPDGEVEYVTQDFEEAPVVSPTETVETPTPRESATAEPAERPTPQREVDRRALFPGRTDNSNPGSQGSTGGTGNQGSLDGTPGGGDGSGAGSQGSGFDLAGRSIMGSLPTPVYGSDRSGRVVVEITVDPGGNVVNATYRARGSTTNDSELVNAAIRAARQSRFNTVTGDQLQTGTITYNFRLR